MITQGISGGNFEMSKSLGKKGFSTHDVPNLRSKTRFSAPQKKPSKFKSKSCSKKA